MYFVYTNTWGVIIKTIQFVKKEETVACSSNYTSEYRWQHTNCTRILKCVLVALQEEGNNNIYYVPETSPFNLHNNGLKILAFPLKRWENWGITRVSNKPKIIQPISSRVRVTVPVASESVSLTITHTGYLKAVWCFALYFNGDTHSENLRSWVS